MNTEVRALPYPVLEPGNLSCPDGVYEASAHVLADRTSARISHSLSGYPFLQNIIADGRAQYACLVAIPITGYRKLHLGEHSEQTVAWEKEFCGEPPMLRPMIITVEEIQHIFRGGDGVDDIWQGRELTIPRGARLAMSEYWGETATMERLLQLDLREDMPNGSFCVDTGTDQGFYFKVKIAPDLHHFLQKPGGHLKHQQSILTHIVSQCLEILARDFGRPMEEDNDGRDWRIHQNLKGLAGLLNEKGQPLWDEDGFASDEVATKLYPHFLPTEDAKDTEGDPDEY